MIWKTKGYKNNNVVYLFKKYEMALSLPPPFFWVGLVYGVYLMPLSTIFQSYRGF